MRIRQALLAFTAILTVASAGAQSAGADPIGARIYMQPWNAVNPQQDAVQTLYDGPDAISGGIDTAWNTARQVAMTAVPKALNNYDIGDGFSLYDVDLTLNPATNYTLKQTGPNTALLQFTIPKTTLDASVRTPGPAPSSTDPRFRVSGDLVVSVQVTFSTQPGQLIKAGKVDAVLTNVGLPQGLNDSAKVVKDVALLTNDLVAFFSGTNFAQKLLDAVNGQDLGQEALQPAVDTGIDALNTQFAQYPQLAAYLPKAVWADHDRLTFYFAANPVTPNSSGALSGDITWNPSQVSGTCAQVSIKGVVQTGPRPLIDSSGQDYGMAPTATLGSLVSFPTGSGSCDYRVTGLAQDWPTALEVTDTYGAVGGFSTSDPYTGSVHSAAVITPVGWNDSSITPNADDRNFLISRGVGASSAVGAQLNPGAVYRPIGPGDETSQTPGVVNSLGSGVVFHSVAQGEGRTLTAGEASSLNPQPLPPKVGAVGVAAYSPVGHAATR